MRVTRLRAAAFALALTPLGLAQEGGRPALPPVELSPAAQSRLDAPYLSEEEQRALRLYHGVWTDADLVTPADRARAALVLGLVDHPALDDEEADPLDRAKALLGRGDPEAALRTLEGRSEMRAVRLRAEALMTLGRFDEADAAVEPVVDRMIRARLDSARDVSEGVRALMVRARVRGSQGAGGSDFRQMLQILSKARDELDRLSWEVRVTEAELLYEKHNNQEARAAALEALRLNPRCARAWRVLGEVGVDGFAFDAANAVARRLDAMSAPAGVLNRARSFSPEAALIRSRARLRQRDPEGAERALDELLLAMPEHREALALQAASAAVAFRYASVDRALEKIERLSPGAPDALFQVGRALAESRQYEASAGYLERAIERLPNWSAPLIELGLLEVQSGRDDRARRWLARAVELDPFNVRAVNSLKLVTDLRQFETVESEHFIVRYRPGVDRIMAREMLPVLERAHQRVAGAERGGLDHEPDRKTLIELMPDHAWFSVRITGMTEIHTMAASTGPVIAMEAPREGKGQTAGQYDWARVVQHEYTHTVSLSRTNNRIPHWFTEAVSVFMEDAPRSEGTWGLLLGAYQAGTLFDLEEINLAFVRPKKPTDRSQAYAQGHWMYQFIVDRWGADAPLRLMDRYAAGEREASAFETVLGLDSQGFLEAFTRWARQDLVDHGLLLPEGVPSVPEMLKQDRAASPGENIRPDEAFVTRWLERHPGHPELLRLRLAQTRAAAQSDLDPILIEPLEAYAAARPVAEEPHRLLARIYLSSEEHATRREAIEHLEFLDAREQRSAAYAIELARLYAADAQWDRATAKAERANTIAPFDADVRELAARIAIKSGRLTDAERHIEALTLLEPDRELHQRRLEAIRTMISKAG
ncbi:MAG: peptidase MA family metallohydrolase [Phycisphaerales bacterium JB059]